MPPKYKFQKKEIVAAALDIARQKGLQAVTARAVGEELGSSSKVIFGLFENMEELHGAVIRSAYDEYLAFLTRHVETGQYPPYKAMGMAYISFATEEKALFKLLFMCDQKERGEISSPDFDRSVELIREANGLTREEATLMHLEMWVCVHGIAAMEATSFLALGEALISQILTDTYQGLCHRHRNREE